MRSAVSLMAAVYLKPFVMSWKRGEVAGGGLYVMNLGFFVEGDEAEILSKSQFWRALARIGQT